MKTGAGLALIAVGAILAFAVSSSPSGFNINIAGWVLVIVGVIGLVLPMRTYGWIGQRITRRTYPTRDVPVTYVTRDPNPQVIEAAPPARPTLLDQEVVEETQAPTTVTRQPAAPTTEVVEDLYEQP